MQSPSHVKTISAAHKNLLRSFKQAEARLILTHRTLAPIGRGCVNLQECFHCSVRGQREGGEAFSHLQQSQQKTDTFTPPDLNVYKATVRPVCSAESSEDDMRDKKSCAPLGSGDKTDHTHISTITISIFLDNCTVCETITTQIIMLSLLQIHKAEPFHFKSP